MKWNAEKGLPFSEFKEDLFGSIKEDLFGSKDCSTPQLRRDRLCNNSRPRPRYSRVRAFGGYLKSGGPKMAVSGSVCCKSRAGDGRHGASPGHPALSRFAHRAHRVRIERVERERWIDAVALHRIHTCSFYRRGSGIVRSTCERSVLVCIEVNFSEIYFFSIFRVLQSLASGE